jgi:hypothetical protein
MKHAWRHCRDLSRTRLAIAVLCAPFPIAGILLAIDDFGWAPRTIMIWFIAIAAAFLVGSCALVRKVGRIGCLVVGFFAGAAWPYAVVGMTHFPDPIRRLLDITVVDDGSLFERQLLQPHALELAAIGCGAGLYIGWVLWRLGVRPAPEPLPDDAVEAFS